VGQQLTLARGEVLTLVPGLAERAMNVPLSSNGRHVAPSLASHSSSGLPDPA